MNHDIASAQRLETITQLQAGIRAVVGPFAPCRKFALVDFPNYANVGDSAIWLGEMKFMREVFGAPPAYVASIHSFDAAACEAAIGDGPIFIHGGGNFGDLWPHHQNFRLRLLAAFKGQPIIQLPQSLHFNHTAAIAATAQAIRNHGQFTLFVRDETSKKIADSFDCRTALTCDLAMYLGPLDRVDEPTRHIVCLMRTDKERVVSKDLTQDTRQNLVVDWRKESRTSVRMMRFLSVMKMLSIGKLKAHDLQMASFDAAALARLRRGIRLLSLGRAVVTDRLHGHILCLLLGIPHAVLDNSYRKLDSFIQCWIGESPYLLKAQSLPQAMDWAEFKANQICRKQFAIRKDSAGSAKRVRGDAA